MSKDSFRPRFPLDPYIAQEPEPWSLSVDRLPTATSASQRLVILVVGECTATDLDPLLHSSHFSSALLLLACHTLPVFPASTRPAVRLLRLPAPLLLENAGTARYVSVIEWAARVARTWRSFGGTGVEETSLENSTAWSTPVSSGAATPPLTRFGAGAGAGASRSSLVSPSPQSSQSHLGNYPYSPSPSPVPSIASSNASSLGLAAGKRTSRRASRLLTKAAAVGEGPPTDTNQRAFDVLLNFMPPNLPEKALLKQAILVTTISRSFLVASAPVQPPPRKGGAPNSNNRMSTLSPSSPTATSSASRASKRFSFFRGLSASAASDTETPSTPRSTNRLSLSPRKSQPTLRNTFPSSTSSLDSASSPAAPLPARILHLLPPRAGPPPAQLVHAIENFLLSFLLPTQLSGRFSSTLQPGPHKSNSASDLSRLVAAGVPELSPAYPYIMHAQTLGHVFSWGGAGDRRGSTASADSREAAREFTVAELILLGALDSSPLNDDDALSPHHASMAGSGSLSSATMGRGLGMLSLVSSAPRRAWFNGEIVVRDGERDARNGKARERVSVVSPAALTLQVPEYYANGGRGGSPVNNMANGNGARRGSGDRQRIATDYLPSPAHGRLASPTSLSPASATSPSAYSPITSPNGNAVNGQGYFSQRASTSTSTSPYLQPQAQPQTQAPQTQMGSEKTERRKDKRRSTFEDISKKQDVPLPSLPTPPDSSEEVGVVDSASVTPRQQGQQYQQTEGGPGPGSANTRLYVAPGSLPPEQQQHQQRFSQYISPPSPQQQHPNHRYSASISPLPPNAQAPVPIHAGSASVSPGGCGGYGGGELAQPPNAPVLHHPNAPIHRARMRTGPAHPSAAVQAREAWGGVGVPGAGGAGGYGQYRASSTPPFGNVKSGGGGLYEGPAYPAQVPPQQQQPLYQQYAQYPQQSYPQPQQQQRPYAASTPGPRPPIPSSGTAASGLSGSTVASASTLATSVSTTSSSTAASYNHNHHVNGAGHAVLSKAPKSARGRDGVDVDSGVEGVGVGVVGVGVGGKEGGKEAKKWKFWKSGSRQVQVA